MFIKIPCIDWEVIKKNSVPSPSPAGLQYFFTPKAATTINKCARYELFSCSKRLRVDGGMHAQKEDKGRGERLFGERLKMQKERAA